MRNFIQFGGYIISAFLIIWLINPVIALALLEVGLKMVVFVGTPITGAIILNKVITFRNVRAWNISITIWLMGGVALGIYLMRFIGSLFS